MDKRRAFVALMLAMTGPTIAIAGEEAHDRGAIALTFHENGMNRLKSEGFYVVQENGQVRWQNYKERAPQNQRAKKVFELKEGSAIQQNAQNLHGPSAVASAINK